MCVCGSSLAALLIGERGLNVCASLIFIEPSNDLKSRQGKAAGVVASALEFNFVFSNDSGARGQDSFRMWSSWKFESSLDLDLVASTPAAPSLWLVGHFIFRLK